MSQRILHIADSLARTGKCAQLLVLARQLAEAGFDVHVAALGGRGGLEPQFRASGLSVDVFSRRFSRDPVALLQLQRLVRRLRPDVIHTWDEASAASGRLVVRTAGGARLVVGQYEIEPWKPRWRWALERRLVADSGTHYVADSRAARDWCVGSGLPAEKVAVIGPGVPPARPSDVSREDLLRELQLPAEARLIGVVGRLAPEKRVKDLIWAADLLRVLHDNLRLLVIGDGPLRAALEQYARLASDLDHIRFLGERDDLWRIMPHLDVMWNASESRRHSIAILEAMAAGVPVVASDTPQNRELVVEDQTGYLIPLGTRAGRATRARHTDRIFNDRDLAARLGTASCRRAAECFSAGRMVRHYTDLYQ